MRKNLVWTSVLVVCIAFLVGQVALASGHETTQKFVFPIGINGGGAETDVFVSVLNRQTLEPASFILDAHTANDTAVTVTWTASNTTLGGSIVQQTLLDPGETGAVNFGGDIVIGTGARQLPGLTPGWVLVETEGPAGDIIVNAFTTLPTGDINSVIGLAPAAMGNDWALNGISNAEKNTGIAVVNTGEVDVTCVASASLPDGFNPMVGPPIVIGPNEQVQAFVNEIVPGFTGVGGIVIECDGPVYGAALLQDLTTNLINTTALELID